MCNFDRVLIKTFSLNDKYFIDFLLKKISEVLKIDAYYLNNSPLPYDAYDGFRKQFLAEKFLENLILEKSEESEIILGVTSVDLYEPGLNFVFGMASPFYSVAIISTKRLHNLFYALPEDKSLFFERSLKEAIHEIGHTLGLEHCPNPKCVMHFSNSIVDTDKKSYNFCDNCWEKAKDKLCIKV
ncbi:archaemetzincin family Zn-dependent metalloprotease [Nitrosophilus kaiyonis]|uniref:archaemetzincin family Zn-dependent metalloprotease n=1 Tax=Nitrosophilus kaiyonis TaxID=2930200 RepID=UPI00249170A8|nr:archaemetzincin family Zn-dependent metalloprotease [Nitrosophilus kaiyonis]